MCGMLCRLSHDEWRTVSRDAHSHANRRANTFATFESDRAARGGDDGPADREAEPGAAAVAARREEPLAGARESLGVHADAGIRDRELDLITGARGRDRDDVLTIGGRGARRVHEQVQDDLHEAAMTAEDSRHIDG